MTHEIMDGRNVQKDESSLSERLAYIFGIDPSSWNISFGVVMKGRSGVLHTFDAVLESLDGDSLATVMFLKETDENKSEALMMHRIKSNDTQAKVNYVVADHEFNSRENTVKEMCHFRDFRVDTEELEAYRYRSAMRIEAQTVIEKFTENPQNISSEGNRHTRRKNRDRTKIVHEILGSVIYLKNASITQLIYRCNLNYRYAKNLLNQMVVKKLLEVVDYEGIGKRYLITNKGLKTFERLEFHEYV